MRQYAEFKSKHPEALLLFRVGDFYETFGQDAVITSRILGIVLTKRGNGSANEVELAGFPHHAIDTYLPKLVRAGQRVAICDQLEDPKFAKTIVKRGVTELVTPGVSLSDKILDSRANNFLAGYFAADNRCGIAFLDISTGECFISEGNQELADKLFQSLDPAEIILPKSQKALFHQQFSDRFFTYFLDDWVFEARYCTEKILAQFGAASLKGFGVQEMQLGIIAAGACFQYLADTQHHKLGHFKKLARLDEGSFVWLDRFTQKNLELLAPAHENGTSFLDVMDDTVCPMGARLLRRWIVFPLKNRHEIESRLEVVRYLVENRESLDNLRREVQKVGDLERLASKMAVGRINPRELNQLARGQEVLSKLKAESSQFNSDAFKRLLGGIDDCAEMIQRIRHTLMDDAPAALGKAQAIRTGFNAELDEYRTLMTGGKEYLVEIKNREVERTGISSLKISFNNVFGYFLEVTNAHKDKVPPEWIRKQTLVNAERYITEELKTYEEKILSAENRVAQLEEQIYDELMVYASAFAPRLIENARIIAAVDCLQCFAHIAIKNRYTCPKIHDGLQLKLIAARHPVIENQMKAGEEYIPNDLDLDPENRRLMILTGPNMAGKSAFLRQTALCVIMAQMGCFVPAQEAHIGLVDKIFTRVGASDNISSGESTFMVEMMETASILNNLSARSLILLDEIGRGTSTFDGISLAWAIAEHLNNSSYRPKTIFATHYHELNELSAKNQGIFNMHVQVKEIGNRILFMRKLAEGGTESSFGLHVAQMAAIPPKVIDRAKDILTRLEADRASISGRETLKNLQRTYQVNLFEAENPGMIKLREELENIDINALTPVEALLKIQHLKALLN